MAYTLYSHLMHVLMVQTSNFGKLFYSMEDGVSEMHNLVLFHMLC